MFTNTLVMFSFRSLIKILVGDCFNQMVWKLSLGNSRARASRSYIALVEVKLGGSCFEDRVDLKTEFLKKTFDTIVQFVFRSFCKDQNSVICSSSQHTHVSYFGFGFSAFGLTDIGFHEQIDQNKFTWFKCILDMFYIHACFN